MRLDTLVFLEQQNPRVYDSATGNYSKPTYTVSPKMADVTYTGTQVQMLLYGRAETTSLTVRVLGPIAKPDRVTIHGEHFKVDSYRRLRRITTLVVSEVE